MFKEIFNNRLTAAAGILFVIFLVLVGLTSFSHFPYAHPLWGVILFGLAPVCFIVGGVIFILAILKTEGRNNERQGSQK